jgi:hypothetical protein
MRRTTVIDMLALAAGVLLGCGEEERPARVPDAAAAVDARVDAPLDAPPDAAMVDAPDARPPCNTLVNVGQNVGWFFVTEERPTPTGGTIIDGTYVLTSQVTYGAIGPTGPIPVGAETIEIAGTVMQTVKANLAGGGGLPPDHGTDSLTPLDTTHVVVQQTCAVDNPPVLNGFVATPTSVAFYNGDTVFTYKRP